MDASDFEHDELYGYAVWEVYRLDENGQLDTRPILPGQNLNYEQKLPQKWLGKLKYRFNDTLTFYT